MVNKRKLEKVIEIGLPDDTYNYVHEIGDAEITDDLVLKNGVTGSKF